MTEQTTDIINYDDKEVERLQKEQEDKIYRTHALSIKDFLERKKKWDEVQSIYGSDPYFYQLFGFLDPMLALSFVKEEDINKVVDSFTEKEITQSVHRNPTHARLLRKLKDKRHLELKEKSQP
jgi:hypothetical protein